MSIDPKQIVQDGYDAIASEYAAWASRIVDSSRDYWTRFLIDALPAGTPLLDLGCGHGLPSVRTLATTLDVTGVDISSAQIEAARRNVPAATFIRAEMMDVDFPAGYFGAVTAFYSIIHLPRDEQPLLFRRAAGWLQSGGYLVTVLGASDSPADIDPNWLGSPMFWSHHPPETNEAMATGAGLEIIVSEEHTIFEDDRPAKFHWLICQKPEVSRT